MMPWMYGVTVVALLAAHGWTLHMALGRIQALKDALAMREILLADDRTGEKVYANGVLVRTLRDYGIRLRIWTQAETHIELTVEEI